MKLFAPHPDAGTTHRGEVRRLFFRLYPRYWFPLTIVVVLSALVGLTTYGYAWAGKVIADDVVQVQLLAENQGDAAPSDVAPPPTDVRAKTTPEKVRLLMIVAGLILLMEITRHAADWIILERTVLIGQQVTFRLRLRLQRKLTALPLHYHDRHSPGRLLTHLFSDVSSIEMMYKAIIRELSGVLLSIVAGTWILLAVDWRMALIVLLTLPAYVTAYRTVRYRFITVNRTWREQEARLNGFIANRVSGFPLVKAFGRERHEGVAFVRAAKPVMRDAVTAQMLNAWFGAACGIITGVCMTAVLWIGVLRVRDGQLTLGDLLLFYASAGTLFSPVARLTHMTGMVHRLRAIAARINDVLDEPITIDDPAEPVAMPDRSCELRFEHVTMRYQPDRPPALDDVSFTLPAGRRLCVMGPSGSGKTTLAKLAVRLYDPQQGRVLYDGVDVRHFKLDDLRDYAAMVNQEPIVFSGSIAENIRYGSDDATPESVSEAAKYAQIQQFIEQLPQQYQTQTHERGLTLSGGQKQRLNLARALHAGPKLLVLDDCTSALDAQTEALIIDAFRSALHKRTAIMVTHRVSLAFECDYVLTLDQGKVIEYGPPGSLAKGNGPFAVLFREQTGKAQRTIEAAQRA